MQTDASPAAATPPALSLGKRAETIRANLAPHLQRMPANWSAWPDYRLAAFRALMEAHRKARSAARTIETARQLAEWYGLLWTVIDPEATA